MLSKGACVNEKESNLKLSVMERLKGKMCSLEKNLEGFNSKIREILGKQTDN